MLFTSRQMKQSDITSCYRLVFLWSLFTWSNRQQRKCVSFEAMITKVCKAQHCVYFRKIDKLQRTNAIIYGFYSTWTINDSSSSSMFVQFQIGRYVFCTPSLFLALKSLKWRLYWQWLVYKVKPFHTTYWLPRKAFVFVNIICFVLFNQENVCWRSNKHSMYTV